MKTAAAILSVPMDALPRRLILAAEKTVSTWRHHFVGRLPEGDRHSLFYFMEGLVIWGVLRADEEAFEDAASVYRRVMNPGLLQKLLSKTRKEWAPARSDILAQSLRMGCVLKNMGLLHGTGWELVIDSLADALLGYVETCGAVRFSNQADGHWNSWSAMFAYQALRFYEHMVDEKSFDMNWLLLLI